MMPLDNGVGAPKYVYAASLLQSHIDMRNTEAPQHIRAHTER